jgi:sirohydrochlorin ferrochelatase
VTPSGPSLVLVAHGTREPAGLRELEALADLVRAEALRSATPEFRPAGVRLCFLDVLSTDLATALAEVDGSAVVVPLLLATGFHLRVDIPAMVAGRARAVVTPSIGPDPLTSEAALSRVLDRAADAGMTEAEARQRPLVVAAAGSTDPAALDDLAVVAEHLRSYCEGGVSWVQLSDPDALTSTGPDALVVNYLLAPGFFDARLRERAGRRIVGRPIGAHPLVVRAVLQRYRLAAEALL